MKRMRPPKLLVGLLAAAIALPACAPQTDAGGGAAMTTEVHRTPWQTGSTAGSELTTAHYRIFTTATNRALVTYMPGFLEAAYRNYLDLTGLADRPHAPPMPVYLMATRREWASLTVSVVGEQAAGPYLGIQAGGYCYEGVCVFWDIGVLGTFSVASHEGLHQFFHHRLRDRLPMWLEEGLCTMAEGYDLTGDRVTFTPQRNNFRFTDLRAAIVQGRTLPLEELLTTDSGEAIGGTQDQATGYYGQLWALVQFIRSNPAALAGMQRLLADAEAGRLHQGLHVTADDLAVLRHRGRAYNKTVSLPLFRLYIASDLAAFERDFKAFSLNLARLQ
jgi:hypothetical protein